MTGDSNCRLVCDNASNNDTMVAVLLRDFARKKASPMVFPMSSSLPDDPGLQGSLVGGSLSILVELPEIHLKQVVLTKTHSNSSLLRLIPPLPWISPPETYRFLA